MRLVIGSSTYVSAVCSLKLSFLITMSNDYAKLIRFLQEDMAIPSKAIQIALKQCKADLGPLPMVLWQQGVLSLKQLEKIFDWLETSQAGLA